MTILRYALYAVFVFVFIVSSDVLGRYHLVIARFFCYFAGLTTLIFCYLYERSGMGRRHNKWLAFPLLFLIFFVVMFIAGFEARLSGVKI